MVDLVEFPPVRPKNLIRLGEDLLHAFSTARLHGIPRIHQHRSLSTRLEQGSKYISLISGLIPKDGNTLTSLSSREEAELAELFHLKVPFPYQIFPKSQTFIMVRPSWSCLSPRSEISGQTCGSDFTPTPSSANCESSLTWNCVMSPRTTPPLVSRISGREIVMGNRCASGRFGRRIYTTWRGFKVCVTLLFYQRRAQRPSYQTFRRVIKESRPNPHPNVLFVVKVSATLFPLCVMTPWMPDGNVVQYIQINPHTDRLVLVRVHRPEDRRG